ncbi:hypothetical protein C3007_07025 [Avibacterium gallinarum]|uniref:Uncharacterized protein n=1 Tax=Avibacterium gallinarum TaxID=755 RepID=A0A379B0Q9_AVIGA|nr:hypothetical protein [Avibacterium gallinarum]POY44064.1 hypothetical protein C3007_07025 [Avibacterium gallinarum]TDP29133.1 hypothetical protein EV689_10350 [Avibacterium gallinarum]SUB28438.1 Uncharacterised protein [Avibacterium gallinarum]
MSNTNLAYEVGVYANDGGFRGYIANLKTNLNIYRTPVCHSPRMAKETSEFKEKIQTCKQQGIMLFFEDNFTKL